MCVIIDTNVISLFAQANNPDSLPLRNWILEGKGKIVYGGTKYQEETSKVNDFLGLITNLKPLKKCVVLDTKYVDDLQRQIEDKAKELRISADFDDPHLIAIISASKCKVIYTNDERAIKYLKNNNLYLDNAKRPKIYKGAKQSKLVRKDDNIAPCCR